jgi:hypothetical protein
MSHRLATALGSSLVLVALLGGCKKQETAPDTIKDTSTQDQAPAPPTPAPAASSAASASPDGGTSTPPGTPTGSVAQPKGSGLEACCSALQSSASSGTEGQKTRAKQAAQLCQGISALVKQGKTSRAAAMSQLRSAAGGSLPGACR